MPVCSSKRQTDVPFVGTPTQGANGDVTLMVLPGNLPVSFSTRIRHADAANCNDWEYSLHVVAQRFAA